MLSEPDPILAVGAIVANRLYGRTCPIVVLSVADLERLARSATAEITSDPVSGRAVVSAA